jgi:hypothetical protein
MKAFYYTQDKEKHARVLIREAVFGSAIPFFPFGDEVSGH